MHNPYARAVRVPRRLKIDLGLLVMALLAMLGLLLFHPFFSIQELTIIGTKRLSSAEISSAVMSTLNYRRWFIFPGASYIMADVDELHDVLMKKYSLSSVRIVKSFPHELAVDVQEKISTVIYDNGSTYSFIDPKGNVVEVRQQVTPIEWKGATVASSTVDLLGNGAVTHTPAVRRIKEELGDYPIIYDTRHKKVDADSQVVEEKTVSGIIEWFEFFYKQTNVPFGYIEISDERGEGVIKTGDGWEARVNLIENLDGQTELLSHLLNEQTNRSQLSYVDLRYAGKVYWK